MIIKLKMETNEGNKRLKNEYQDLTNNIIVSLGICVGLVEDNDIYNWQFYLLGPKDTPYSGGFFKLHLKFPKEYPEKKPEIVFVTPIYHPNVNSYKRENDGPFQLGYVGVNFINDWKPKTTPREILTRLYSIFYLPSDESGFDFKMVTEIKINYSLYVLKAKYFTKKYASFSQKQVLYDDSWDFSFNENDLTSISPIMGKKIIKSSNNDNNNEILNFRINDNGRELIYCHCNINDRISDILKRYNLNLTCYNLLCICNGKKIDISYSLKDIGVLEGSEIVLISEVVFA